MAIAVFLAACPAGGGGPSSSITAYPYVCPNGTPASGQSITEGTERCSSCNSGFTIENNICTPDSGFAYVCNNGTRADGTTDMDNVERCNSCLTGWRLSGVSCGALCSVASGTYTLEPTADGGSQLTFRMITVPVGNGLSFFTGQNDDGEAMVDATYDIAETELTYAVYQRVHAWATDSGRGANAYSINAGRQGNDNTVCTTPDPDEVTRTPQHPVTCINWYDSVKFANALSEYCTAAGITPVYLNGIAVMRSGTTAPTLDSVANGFRLLSDNEWALAARYRDDINNDGDIKDSNEFYPGSVPSGADASTDAAVNMVAWYLNNSDFHTHPVAQKNANALGLYDMSGNQSEWLFDFVSSTRRRVRGSNWSESATSSRLSRGFGATASILFGYGTRLAR